MALLENYLFLGALLPLPPPEGLPVVLGQLPPFPLPPLPLLRQNRGCHNDYYLLVNDECCEM